MSEIVDCINSLTAKDIIRRAAKTANGVPFYIQTSGLSGFCAAYQAYYDAMPVKPSAAYADAQNTMICGLVDAGYWANNIDAFWWFAQETNGGDEAQINAHNPGTYDCVEIPNGGALTFTALEGLQGDGNAYLNTGIVLTALAHFSLNSAGFMYAVQNNVFEATYDIGVISGANTARVSHHFFASGSTNGRMNGGDELSGAGTITEASHIAFRRQDSNVMRWDINKVHINDTGASTGVPITWPVYIFALNSNNTPSSFCNRRISYAIITDGLSDGDSDAIVDLCEACLDSVGKGLLP